MRRFILILILLSVASWGLAQEFSTQEFTVDNGKVQLPGTLCVAGDVATAPILVFVHGSGPNDRDETIGPNKFFKQIAEGLAGKGISSLRYDKRTLLYKEGSDTLTYYGESVEDAVQAVRQLHAIGYRHIYVAGHSLGGHVAPLIALETKDMLEGVILLSANVGTLENALDAQLHYLGKQQGLQESQIRQLLKNMTDGLPTAYLDFDRTYRPAVYVEKLRKEAPSLRWLVMQGGHDYQVTSVDYMQWQMMLKQNATYFYGEMLDHILRPLPKTATPDDYQQPGSISPEVIEGIATFVLK